MASRYVLHLYLFLCTLTEKTFIHKSGEHVLVGVIRVIHSTGWTAMKSCMVARRHGLKAVPFYKSWERGAVVNAVEDLQSRNWQWVPGADPACPVHHTLAGT